jgi:CheY-like chemotaxis protein
MDRADASHSKVAPAFADAPGLHILLAEDNPINMMLIRELLRRRGHRVTEVTTGNAAVEAMEEGSFDLLLTDIHMPGMDGIEAARAIRAGEAASGRARTPIVALTADALESGKRSCREAGMDGFLTKPVDPAELEEMFLMLFPSEDRSHIVVRISSRHDATPATALQIARLSESQSASDAGAGFFFRPALQPDRQHAGLLAAR